MIRAPVLIARYEYCSHSSDNALTNNNKNVVLRNCNLTVQCFLLYQKLLKIYEKSHIIESRHKYTAINKTIADEYKVMHS